MSLSTNITDLATRVATESKSLRTLINGNNSSLSALTTTATSNLVAAINELHAAVVSAGSINDATTSSSTTWSSTKTSAEIAAAVAALVAAAPAALDTLVELSAALGGDANFATTIATALGLRVRVDAVQSFTDPQQVQGRANLAAAGSADVGSTTADFTATFVAGLL
jgi:hypothetical protein